MKRSATPNERRFVVKKRSVKLYGQKTSVSLEDAFWNALVEIAAANGATVASTIEQIGGHAKVANLSSHIRTAVLDFYVKRSKNALSAHS